MTTLGTLIVSFFRNYLANQKGYTRNTIASYSDCIRLLLSYSCDRLGLSFDKLSLEMISDQIILDFLDHLEQDRGNVPQTRNQRLGAIKTFFRFLTIQEPTVAVVCERVCAISFKKTEHKVVATLDNNEIDAILAEVKTDALQGVRDQALLSMLYNTGARVQELIDLNVSDLRTESPLQVLLTGKGRKQRIVPLHAETVSTLQDYLDQREQLGTENEALFLNARGERITRFGIGHILSKYAALASRNCPSLASKNVTPHTYRHTTALHLIQSGNDISVVKDWLGHADIKTTSQYVEINIEMKRKALETLPPPQVPQAQQDEKPQWHNSRVLRFLEGLSKQVSRPTALC